jgi:TonB-dependent receptor
MVTVRMLGFAPDSFVVVVAEDRMMQRDDTLRLAPAVLATIAVRAQRLGETKAAALDKQKDADNIVTVLSGDEIRALPNANAAEAAGRIPGVAIERDEGEGKFIQIRGTEPRLSNVTVDGSHIPGTEQGDRRAKLDDVPSDILAAIEVSKTLTADMDADAVGGSVNLVTKTPEGAPRGYVAGQFGHITLLNQTTGQGSFTYGGRFGTDRKLGLLIGGSVDRNNRSINDVEPSWAVDGQGRPFPNEWSQRDYAYYRSRFGVGGDVDYRFSDRSSVYLKGMWSLFKNHGTRYVYDVSTGQSAFADTLNTSAVGDSAPSGPTGYGTGAVLTRESSQRTPTEQLWGLVAGGKHDLGGAVLEYTLNAAGTRQSVEDYRFSPFVFSGNGGGLTIKYDASNISLPTYQFLNAAQAADAANPGNFALASYSINAGLTTGRDLGGGASVLLPYQWGDHTGGFKFGVRVRDETKDFTNQSQSFQATGTLPLTQVLGTFQDPNFYTRFTNAFVLGPVPDNGASVAWENAHPGAFTNTTDTVGNALASFSGTERIYAGYVMNTMDFGRAHLNLGLRVEHTVSSYIGHVASTPTDSTGTPTGPTTVTTVPGSQNYTDLFPSAQLRYGVDYNTNVRLAVTRAIARPNYSDLAPSLSGNLGATYRNQFTNLTSGNPNLRPERAWNFDLLVEHFLPSVGVISAGLFYKRLTDVILVKDFVYSGPYAPFVGYAGTQPQNGGDGHLEGFELDWAQHLTFLPGLLAGLGFDVNYTYVHSKVVVDTSGREAPLLRQAPSIANVALTYDRGPVSSRIAWTYNGANIAGYGDGSASPTGDNYFYSHSQIDASLILNVTRTVQLQLMVLNINNAVFGFFNGTPDHAYNFQREYYGQTFYGGMKYAF